MIFLISNCNRLRSWWIKSSMVFGFWEKTNTFFIFIKFDPSATAFKLPQKNFYVVKFWSLSCSLRVCWKTSNWYFWKSLGLTTEINHTNIQFLPISPNRFLKQGSVCNFLKEHKCLKIKKCEVGPSWKNFKKPFEQKIEIEWRKEGCNLACFSFSASWCFVQKKTKCALRKISDFPQVERGRLISY